MTTTERDELDLRDAGHNPEETAHRTGMTLCPNKLEGRLGWAFLPFAAGAPFALRSRRSPARRGGIRSFAAPANAPLPRRESGHSATSRPPCGAPARIAKLPGKRKFAVVAQ